MQSIGIALAGFAALLTASQAYGQSASQIELRLQAMDTQRQAVVAQNLPLDDAVSEKFWERYHEYREEVRAADKQRLALLKELSANYESLEAAKANDLVRKATSLEVDRMTLKRAHMRAVSKVLNGATFFRYYQIETKLDALHTANWTRQVPLALTDAEIFSEEDGENDDSPFAIRGEPSSLEQ